MNVGASPEHLSSDVPVNIGRDSLGSANSAVLTADHEDDSNATNMPCVTRGIPVEEHEAAGSDDGGGSGSGDNDGLRDTVGMAWRAVI